MDYWKLSIAALHALLCKREISARALTEYFLDRINRLDAQYSAYITVCRDEALAAADRADEMIKTGKATALTGIPLAVKDNISTKDIKTTCASKMLKDYVPPYDATVIALLKDQGAVILGKANMDEFAMGGASQTSCFGGVKNPWDTTRVPGGSSGGSAAAVAAGLCAAALGSDTGGSIRQPSSFCGITGIKPTYGSVSRYGLIAFASSLDQIGVLAKSAQDCEAVLAAIALPDKNDGTMLPEPLKLSSMPKLLSDMTIGVPAEFMGEGIAEDVKEAVKKGIAVFETMGAAVKPVSLPSLRFAVPAYYLISSAEASSNLARYDGIKFGYRSDMGDTYDELIRNTRQEGFGTEVKRRILLGNYALCSGFYDDYYRKAGRIRDQLKAEYAAIFETCDFIITPTAPTAAYPIGAQEDDPVRMYLADICTVTVNIAGLPAVNTTCGYTKAGLPVGMSLVGRPASDGLLLCSAKAFESQFQRREALA